MRLSHGALDQIDLCRAVILNFPTAPKASTAAASTCSRANSPPVAMPEKSIENRALLSGPDDETTSLTMT